MYKNSSEMVRLQGLLVDQIHNDIEDIDDNVEKGKKNISEVHRRESKNRSLIYKMFTTLYVITFVYIVFLSWYLFFLSLHICISFMNFLTIFDKIILLSEPYLFSGLGKVIFRLISNLIVKFYLITHNIIIKLFFKFPLYIWKNQLTLLSL